jgi:sec-independent protein translocase protein TatC
MNHQEQPLIEHLTELRRRLVYSVIIFVGCFCFFYYHSEALFNFLVKPLVELLQTRPGERKLIYTGVTEAFTTYIKVSGFFSLIFTMPFFAIQLWKFIAPGLYKQEKNLFRLFLFLTPLLFLSGALFAYYVIFPTAYNFFLSFETTQGPIPIQLEAKINEYLSFVMRLILAFGTCFELPIVLSLLAWGNIIHSHLLIKHWRIAVVLIFAISAIITPPDLLSMIGLAVPLIGLYVISLKMVQAIEYYKNKQSV